MSNYYIDGPSLGKRSVRLSPPIAQGAAGTIHHVVGDPGIVVKLYKNPKDTFEYSEKIAAMLAAPPDLPPFLYNGQTYVQIAWPLGTVSNGSGDFLGFVMPAVDIQSSVDLENILQKATRTRKGLPEFYGARVLLAANLAALMAELHGLGHHMIDMKPINMRFYPHAWYMAIIDTDGFSINGQRRFPARQFSDEYIAPEARGMSPEKLGLEQDLFALSIILFRLLNNGLHPFQGVDLNANQPTTLQERIYAGLYAYGLTQHRGVNPAPSSIHTFLEHETQQLFDRAFLSTSGRPTAVEWRDHLGRLFSNKVLVQCNASKDHAHFSRGCGLCALAKSRTQPPVAPPLRPQSVTRQFNPSVITTGLSGGPRASVPQVMPTVSNVPTVSTVFDWLKNNKKTVGVAIAAVVLAWGFSTPPQTQTSKPPMTQPQTQARNSTTNIAPMSAAPEQIVDRGACPFEGCKYGERWIAKKNVDVYAAPPDVVGVSVSLLKKQMTIQAGTWVRTETGIVLARRAEGRITIANGQTPYGVPGVNGPQLKNGQVIPVYSYLGEGCWRSWINGQFLVICGVSVQGFQGQAQNESLIQAQNEWWIQITTASGTKAWTNSAANAFVSDEGLNSELGEKIADDNVAVPEKLAQIDTLLKGGADLNGSGGKYGFDPMLAVITTNNVDLLRRLMSRGLNIRNGKSCPANTASQGYALRPGGDVMLDFLLENGMRLDCLREPPLHAFLRFGVSTANYPVDQAIRVAKVLVRHGADVNQRDLQDQSIFDVLAQAKEPSRVIALREALISVAPHCREYQSTAVMNGQQVQSSGTACLQGNGTWRIVR